VNEVRIVGKLYSLVLETAIVSCLGEYLLF